MAENTNYASHFQNTSYFRLTKNGDFPFGNVVCLSRSLLDILIPSLWLGGIHPHTHQQTRRTFRSSHHLQSTKLQWTSTIYRYKRTVQAAQRWWSLKRSGGGSSRETPLQNRHRNTGKEQGGKQKVSNKQIHIIGPLRTKHEKTKDTKQATRGKGKRLLYRSTLPKRTWQSRNTYVVPRATESTQRGPRNCSE